MITSISALPEILPLVAVTVVSPAPVPVATPAGVLFGLFVGEVIVAMFVSWLVHCVGTPVRFVGDRVRVEPSL